MKKDYDYDYTVILSEAIERITANEEKSCPTIFTYNKINLKYALERAIYSNYADNRDFLDIYYKWRNGVLPEKILVSDDIEKKLLLIMLNIDQNRINIKSVSRQKVIIKSFVRLLLIVSGINKFAFFARKAINSLNQKKSKYQVLFCSLNERFVKFTKPVFDKTQTSCAYITPDKKTVTYLKKENLPYIELSRFAYFINRWSQPESWSKRFCLLEQYDILYDSIKRIHPKTVVLVEGNASLDEVVNQICKKLNMQSVCIQQGWSPIIHNGFKNMSFSKMLVWGKGFAEILKPYNPKQNFIVAGNYMICPTEIKRINQVKNIAFFLQTNTKRFTRMLNKRVIEEYYELILWTAKNYKNVNVIMREHPVDGLDEKEREPFKKLPNIRFMNPDKYSLKEVMKTSDVSVSIYSSTILESIASGVIPIIFNLTSFPRFCPDIDTEHAGIEVKSLEEAKNNLADWIHNPDKMSSFAKDMEKFKNKYITYSGEVAINNIIREII